MGLPVQLSALDRQHSNKYRPVVRISLDIDGQEGVRDSTAVCSLQLDRGTGAELVSLCSIVNHSHRGGSNQEPHSH